jgi:hypothetical protein
MGFNSGLKGLRASKYFCVPRAISGEVPTSASPQELVNMHLGRKTVLPSELENKLVDYCIIMDQDRDVRT